MPPMLSRLLGFALLLVGGILGGLVLTLMLLPFWSWFEATTGIESIGHSGPANWCYAACVIIATGLLAGLRRLGS